MLFASHVKMGVVLLICMVSNFQGVFGNECTICEANTFCSNEALTSCPDFSESPQGSSEISECVCIAFISNVSVGIVSAVCTRVIQGC